MIKKTKLALFGLAFFSSLLTSFSVQGAEKLFLTYSPLKFSVDIKSLELYADDGTVTKDLEQYLNLLEPEQRKKFRAILTKKTQLDPILISRFFNTKMGEDILKRLGKAITIEGGQNGGIALRGAIIQSALDEEGLTLLNVLKKYPTNIQLQGEFIKGGVNYIDKVFFATNTLIEEMKDWAKEEAKNQNIDYSKLSDLTKLGQYEVKKEVWQLNDTTRNRKFYVDVYIPQGVKADQIPVAVFSHGLSSRPEDFADKLIHTSSYGYLTVAPQHVGSDIIYLQEMFEGLNQDIFDTEEFINRPKDISFVIDELERRNQSQFEGKLNLENIAVGGHSFGGYTALATAGATIDFEYLQKSCDRLYGAIDVALLLQCRALELPRQDYQLKDDRIKAVFVINPVSHYIFGQKGLSKIELPVLLGSGTNDPATPPLFEQAVPFTWLTTPNKYWIILEGQAHVDFTELDGGIQQTIETVTNISLPSQDLISSYTKGVSIAFLEVYLKNNDDFRNYLQSAYAIYLSENQEFQLDFVTSASEDKIKEVITQTGF